MLGELFGDCGCKSDRRDVFAPAGLGSSPGSAPTSTDYAALYRDAAGADQAPFLVRKGTTVYVVGKDQGSLTAVQLPAGTPVWRQNDVPGGDTYVPHPDTPDPMGFLWMRQSSLPAAAPDDPGLVYQPRPAAPAGGGGGGDSGILIGLAAAGAVAIGLSRRKKRSESR